MIDLPNLDDKRFRQIFDEAVATIPMLTDEWTDYNPQDTGIMLLGLLAAMTEMQNFYLNQVGGRFYDKYLGLVTDPLANETTVERIHRFAGQCTKTDVAVTLQDYEKLILSSPFSIKKVKADYKDGFIKLKIFRYAHPLECEEIEALRAWLEPFRLLTARLEIEQTPCQPIDIVCRVTLGTGLWRESACREKLNGILEQAVQEKGLGEVLSLDNIRLEILSLPEVMKIDTLQIVQSGENFLGAASQKDVLLQPQSIEISFTAF